LENINEYLRFKIVFFSWLTSLREFSIIIEVFSFETAHN
jgi:hypothetical protein